MKLYMLRHKPTGLYFKSGRHRDKANLAPKGKTYTVRPHLRWAVGNAGRKPTAEERAVAREQMKGKPVSEWDQKTNDIYFDNVVWLESSSEEDWEVVELQASEEEG